MDDLVLHIAVFALVGLLSGFVAGLFGIGGGTVRVPIFIYLFPWIGIAHPVMMHVATATSMALVIPSAIASTRKQYALGSLDLEIYKYWAVGLLLGAAIGAVLLPHGSTELLQGVVASYMILVGIYTALARQGAGGDEPLGDRKKIGFGSVVGLVATLTGTSGGTLTTPILTALKVPLAKAIAISSATGLVTGPVAAVGAVISGWNARDLPDYSLGYVDMVVFLVMMPTVMISAPWGVEMSHRMNGRALQLTYAFLLVVVGFDLLRRVW